MNTSYFKTLCAFALCLAAAMPGFAKSDDIYYPKRLYLVPWYQDATEDQILFDLSFGLSDNDNDGIYTATFRSAQYHEGRLGFMLYSGDICAYDSEDLWGPQLNSDHSSSLYSDVPFVYSLESGADNHTLGMMIIDNYKDGYLNVSVDWNIVKDGVHTPSISFSSDSQPKFGILPYEIYVIGDFNNFGRPLNSETNGALSIRHSSNETEPFVYSGTVNIPAGTKNFMLYAVALGEKLEVCMGKDTSREVTFNYSSDATEGTFETILSTESLDKDDNLPTDFSMLLQDWNGGDITFIYNAESKELTLTTGNAESGVKDVTGVSEGDIRIANGVVRVNHATTISVYDLAGSKITSAYAVTLDLNNLPQGVYVVTADGKSSKVVI